MFMAEGALCNHALFFASLDVSPDAFLENLPEPIIHDLPENEIKNEISKQNKSLVSDDDLRIAWRYRNLPNLCSSQSSSQFGHYYDLSRVMAKDQVDAVDRTTFRQPSPVSPEPEAHRSKTLDSSYRQLIESVEKKIRNGSFSKDVQSDECSILRIGFHSLGSPLWDESLFSSSSFRPSLFRFMYSLRSIVRRAYAVAMVTIPMYLFQDCAFVSRLEPLCDAMVRFESFAGTSLENDPTFKNYDGLFHVVKSQNPNCLTASDYDFHDLAFKVRRKRFTIEKFCLPPVHSDSRSSADVCERSRQLFAGEAVGGVGDSRPEAACASPFSKNKLDF